MFDNESASGETTGEEPVAAAANAEETTAPVRRTRRRTTKAAADAPAAEPVDPVEAPAEEPAPTTTRRRRKVTPAAEAAETGDSGQQALPLEETPVPVKATRARRSRAKVVEPEPEPEPLPIAAAEEPDEEPLAEELASEEAEEDSDTPEELEPLVVEEEEPPARRGRRAAPVQLLFMPPSEQAAPVARVERAVERVVERAEDEDFAEEEPVSRGRRRRRGRGASEDVLAEAPVEVVEAPVETDEAETDDDDDDDEDGLDANARRRRRRGRRGRGRGRGTAGDELDEGDETAEADGEEAADGEEPEASADEDGEEDGEGLTRRRRRRRRKGSTDTEAGDDPHVVVKIREPRTVTRDRDEVQGVSGSTRLEAKRQRRRDGREQRRTRPPILSESEFLARREAVDRTMVIRQKNDRTQIAVLEDKVLVEHYVTRASSSSMVGNVYLGRVQNVLPSMEAAFVDIGRGRNAVLYAGEVNWDATGLEGRTRTIEQALKSGDSVLVQVTKDPIGTKGARLTSHIALSGRHLVYVPHGNASGISRKLSDVERKRLRDVLKNLVPDGAGVIVRTAAEGASEDDLERDVTRLQAQWEAIQEKSRGSSAPAPLYEEPELVVRVVRDLFNEDFRELVIQGNEAYESVEPYLSHVSPDLVDRVRRYTGTGDVFADLRIDEQLIKALDRRVFLPSGGSLVIDRTEAMTVVDVNTGKYTGAGGNLEETVTRNNLEAAEEIVHQLRLRDLGGIIVIDFIDMVLESNRELVLRRLTECLGRDRTKHQVTEITSLGLVQMTRKRVGQGLLEAFSETCEVCKGRGLIIHTEPIPEKRGGGGNGGGGHNGGHNGGGGHSNAVAKVASATSAPGVSSGVEEADAPAPRSRRRGRRGATAVAEEETAEAVTAVHDTQDAAEEEGFAPIASEDDPDNAEDDDEEGAGNGARRRTRRGGVRRRTRP
ncbi:Rne/Rng family ribonuclease [Dactylosporangium vinaceum]|uniref:Rne/Rng family ribonuclease n=1 Tax=Dactylosporangium vinaceum TaxID=53362 RepID=A0ABV5M5N0_9ACTN|nr:Rne/Rng family ribonuclease [Dactylosporangium vinaceum]UAB95611.1 Rne/Rng family ribonuclease [Dactylosporangium vinaceum]